jgi:hypothetical protein
VNSKRLSKRKAQLLFDGPLHLARTSHFVERDDG